MRTAAVLPWLLLAAALLGGTAALVNLARARSEALVEAEQARIMVEAAASDLASVRRQRATLEGSLDRLERENGQLLELKERLQHDVQVHQDELERLRGTYEELEQKMQKELKSGDIRLSQEGDRLRVGLVDRILFSSGEAEITPQGRELLLRVGAVLATVEGRQIQVSGHTDTTPPGDKIKERFPTNWELSVTRATNVVRFLEEEARVPGHRLVATGYGAHHPIATNNTVGGRAKNRRIEILLVPIIEPVKPAR